MTNSLLDADWLNQLGEFNKLFIGFSGGLDSTVLLYHLSTQSSLVKKITAVHINHGLSSNALVWQDHCQQFCSEREIPLIIKRVEFTRRANIEEAAREARYQEFALLLEADDGLVLGHHADDQAETLLLQLFRGAGIDGLAAMKSRKKFAQGFLLRPFLLYSRQTLEEYAKLHQLKWVDDESNLDPTFARNYLRHQVLPLLRQRWPAVVNNLHRTSQHCQLAQTNLEDLAKIDCPALNQCTTKLPLASLSALTDARLVNVLRVWFKSSHIKLPHTLVFNRLIREVIHAREDAKPQVAWKDGCVRRYQQTLYLVKNESKFLLQQQIWKLFPEPLNIEGLGKVFTKKVNKGLILPDEVRIEIRFRQGGELLNWHGQTKQLKKLFQEWNIPPWQRDKIPLLYVNDQLAAVVGYAISDRFYGETQLDAYQLGFFEVDESEVNWE